MSSIAEYKLYSTYKIPLSINANENIYNRVSHRLAEYYVCSAQLRLIIVQFNILMPM